MVGGNERGEYERVVVVAVVLVVVEEVLGGGGTERWRVEESSTTAGEVIDPSSRLPAARVLRRSRRARSAWPLLVVDDVVVVVVVCSAFVRNLVCAPCAREEASLSRRSLRARDTFICLLHNIRRVYGRARARARVQLLRIYTLCAQHGL